MPNIVPRLSLPQITRAVSHPSHGASTSFVHQVSHLPWTLAVSTFPFKASVWISFDFWTLPTRIQHFVAVFSEVTRDAVPSVTFAKSSARVAAAIRTPANSSSSTIMGAFAYDIAFGRKSWQTKAWDIAQEVLCRVA